MPPLFALYFTQPMPEQRLGYSFPANLQDKYFCCCCSPFLLIENIHIVRSHVSRICQPEQGPQDSGCVLVADLLDHAGGHGPTVHSHEGVAQYRC